MKITFEFDTSSKDFDSSELERIKNANKMAHALYEIANKVRSWINYDEREYISKEEISDSIWDIIKDDNLDINELCNSCRDKLIKELNWKENEYEESMINKLNLIKNNADLHENLLEVIKPYLDDFTGYNEETHMFDIVQAVKEIIERKNS